MSNETDTTIRYTTTEQTNLCTDLGFSPEEAEMLLAQSDKEINASLAIKEHLMSEVAAWIDENGLKQAQAAEILHITRPRVSDLVNRKHSKVYRRCSCQYPYPYQSWKVSVC